MHTRLSFYLSLCPLSLFTQLHLLLANLWRYVVNWNRCKNITAILEQAGSVNITLFACTTR